MVSKALVGRSGGGSSSKQHTPTESPDSLRSLAYARIDDLLSEGPIVGLVDGLKSVYLNETPIENADGSRNFTNLSVAWANGYQDQDPIEGFDAVEAETGVGLKVTTAISWTQTITALATDHLRVRISTPQMAQVQSNGDTTGTSVEYKIELSTDGSAYAEVLHDAITGKTTSKYERSHLIELPPAASSWTVRVRRITADSASGTLANEIYVESYTLIESVNLSYPNSAHVASVFDASQFQSIPSRAFHARGRIIRVPSNYNAETRVYTGIWDGLFQTAYSNNPAWVFYDAVTHPRYGLGHIVAEANVDKWSLYNIAKWCDELVPDGFGGMEPRLTCNVYIQTAEDAYKVLSDLAGVFRGVAYWSTGAITASADMPRDPTCIYTPANVIDGRFEYSGSGRRARHTTALVSWNDLTDFGRPKVEYVEDLDGIARYGINQTEMIAVGCTSRGQARRLGKATLVTERLESDVVSFSVGLEGTLCMPGQIIQIADPLKAGKRTGGRVVSATTATMTVDKIPSPAPVAGNKLIGTAPDGVRFERTIASVAGNVITVTAAFPSIPQPQSVWAVESPELMTQLFRVLSVTEGDGGISYSINALKHEPEKFDWIDFDDPIEERTTVKLDGCAPVTAINLDIIARTTDVESEIVVSADWQAPIGAVAYDVQWRKDDGVWSPTVRQTESRSEQHNAFPGKHSVRVTAIGALGQPSTVKTASVIVSDPEQYPPGINAINEAVSDAQTAADAAQASADAANTVIGVITSDGVLSRVEKTAELIRWVATQNELSDIDAKADTYAVSRTAFDAAFSALNAYILGLNPALSDVTQDTPIVGPTYRAKWTAYLDARTLLLNAISAKAKVLADAASGAASAAQTTANSKMLSYNQEAQPPNPPAGTPAQWFKPSTKETRLWSGSDWALQADQTAAVADMLLVNGDFENGIVGWDYREDAGSWYIESSANAATIAGQKGLVHANNTTTPSARTSNNIKFKCSAGARIRVQGFINWAGAQSGNCGVMVFFTDASNNYLGEGGSWYSDGVSMGFQQWRRCVNTVTAPPGTVQAYITILVLSATTGYWCIDSIRASVMIDNIDAVPDGSTYAKTKATVISNGVPVGITYGRNLLSNPTFDLNNEGQAQDNVRRSDGIIIDDWMVSAAALGGPWVSHVGFGRSGGRAMIMAAEGLINSGTYKFDQFNSRTKIPAMAGQQIVLSAWGRQDYSTGVPAGVHVGIVLGAQCFNAGGGYLGDITYLSLAPREPDMGGTWAQRTKTGTILANTAYIEVHAYLLMTTGSASNIDVSGCIQQAWDDITLAIVTSMDNEIANGVDYGKVANVDLIDDIDIGGKRRIGLRKLGSRQQLAGPRNLPANQVMGFGAVNNTVPLSANSSGQVTVNAFTVNLNGETVSYNAVTNAVTGLAVGTTYVIYTIDLYADGGPRTWYAATTVLAAQQAAMGVVVAGTVTIPSSGSSGGGSGGNGDPDDWCVDWDSVLPDGRLVRELQVGDMVECIDVATGEVNMFPLLAIDFGYAKCYRLHTPEGCSVIQSECTAMDMPDGSIVRTPEMFGKKVWAKPDGVWKQTIVNDLECLGTQRVVKPDFGNRMFAAGVSKDRCIATHNLRAK